MIIEDRSRATRTRAESLPAAPTSTVSRPDVLDVTADRIIEGLGKAWRQKFGELVTRIAALEGERKALTEQLAADCNRWLHWRRARSTEFSAIAVPPRCARRKAPVLIERLITDASRVH